MIVRHRVEDSKRLEAAANERTKRAEKRSAKAAVAAAHHQEQVNANTERSDLTKSSEYIDVSNEALSLNSAGEEGPVPIKTYAQAVKNLAKQEELKVVQCCMNLGSNL